ncbi:hypothetical protein M0Q50_09305 [bacterium]|jgi:hypothetical protein|nr:hypothetical protein [bacterium]
MNEQIKNIEIYNMDDNKFYEYLENMNKSYLQYIRKKKLKSLLYGKLL